jgi:histidine ammonia-lyase
VIVLDGTGLDCAQIHRIAGGEPVTLAPEARKRMAANAARVPPGESMLETKRALIVGAASHALDPDALCHEFIRGHCAGVGPDLPVGVVRAAMAARINVLAQGLSGVRPEAAEVLVAMLTNNVHPRVPSQGSVGAAGDLAPLAHIAWVACGYDGARHAFEPLRPTPKEALALINGCSVTAALAALAVARAERLFDTAVAVTAMTMEVVRADAGAIDERPLAARGHPGAVAVAAELRRLLAGSTQVVEGRETDAFSIRCSATVLGAVRDAIEAVRTTIERELNGAGDNPLLFDGQWIEAGNFHGAPLALAMDHLKIALTHVATLSERRTFRLTYGHLSRGLPSFLVPGTGINSGFMLAQYTAASLTSECKGLAHPASVDTIPTVQHHEDHVSMGPIAARGALRIIECVADVLAIEAILAAQALELRERGLAWDKDNSRITATPVVLAPEVRRLKGVVRGQIPFWEDDDVLHPLLQRSGGLVRAGAFTRVAGQW